MSRQSESIVGKAATNYDSTIMNKIANKQELVWINEALENVDPMSEMGGRKFYLIKAAQNRFIRFMPYIETVFPETAAKKGIIESNIIVADSLAGAVKKMGGTFEGRLLIKDDARLPIAGSVKARGGIHEVLAHAETLAFKAGMLLPTDNYSKMAGEEFKTLFAQHTIQVGSTGNLGLSIGIMSARMGFKVIVHMSMGAKQWKKDLLREYGVTVKEYEGDYGYAVEEGRRLSSLDEKSYFIDDENSENLFMGYATAALRLKVQLFKAGVCVDAEHPLFVYLPCGVGGAPGGIAFGLKQIFGNSVHCFFAEPVGAPCFMLGMASGKKSDISISDIGLDGRTIADGLAVGRPSPLASNVMETLLSGCFTVTDEKLKAYMKVVYDSEGLFMEPSACAGIQGLFIQKDKEFSEYVQKHNLYKKMPQATHVVWATGGGLVPKDVRDNMLGE